ncbi:MAG: NifU family protein [Alphaproteobacteria bacterium]|nr:NifU family protein [Alphaproteobacteria bacterium]
MNHNSELLQKITEVINKDIRPALNNDGGDISVISLDGNVLSVRLEGACSHCPRATITLQNAVQATLRKMVSEDIEIRSV